MTGFPIRHSQKERTQNWGGQNIKKEQRNETHLNLLPNRPYTQPRRNSISLQPFLTLIPRITDPNRNLRPIAIKRNSRHRPGELGVLSQPLLHLVVPDRHGSVGTRRGEGVEGGMEGERVDGPDVVDVVDGLAVAFECVFFFLGGGGRVEVFDGDAAFDGGGCVSWSI
jgi:hypothetical protein